MIRNKWLAGVLAASMVIGSLSGTAVMAADAESAVEVESASEIAADD